MIAEAVSPSKPLTPPGLDPGIPLSITNSWSWPKLMSIESVMSSNHLILCLPFLLLPSILPSIKVLSNELALCIRWSKYWSLSFSISLFNEYSGLISLRIDWFDQKRVFAMTSVFTMTSVLFSWQNSVSLFVLQDQTCLLLQVGISWLPSFSFQSLMMKRTSFWC